MTVPWKKIAKTASELHEKQGYSLIDKSNEDAVAMEVPLVNTVPEDKLLKIAGKSVSPKEIRTFTWDNRKSRFMSRDSAFVWTYYDKDSDTSMVGMGARVDPEVLERLPSDSVIRGYESENSDG